MICQADNLEQRVRKQGVIGTGGIMLFQPENVKINLNPSEKAYQRAKIANRMLISLTNEQRRANIGRKLSSSFTLSKTCLIPHPS